MQIRFKLTKVKQLDTNRTILRISGWNLMRGTSSTYADIATVKTLPVSGVSELVITATPDMVSQLYKDAMGFKDKYVEIILYPNSSTFTNTISTGEELLDDGILSEHEHVAYPSNLVEGAAGGPPMADLSIHRINSKEILEAL
jgi:hypothetical protein